MIEKINHREAILYGTEEQITRIQAAMQEYINSHTNVQQNTERFTYEIPGDSKWIQKSNMETRRHRNNGGKARRHMRRLRRTK